MKDHEVVFVLFDGVKHLDVAGPAEVFAEAARFGAGYRLRYVSPSGTPVRTSTGMELGPSGSAEGVTPVDTVIIPGGDHLPTTPLAPELLTLCADLIDKSDRVATVCTGAFLLAATGALEGRRATTHWAHAVLLGRVHPTIDVVQDALFVTDGKFRTSAGVSAGIDLALSLVEEDYRGDLAREVAQQLVVHMRRAGGQSQFSRMLDAPRGTSDAVRRVIDAVTSDTAGTYAAWDLARISGASHRHLTRLFQEEIGTTPAKHIEQIRLETAKSMLLNGMPVSTVSRRAGFQTPETMRRQFIKHLGVPPTEFRRRFATTTANSTAK